ncbi:esterase-like activity of phytase family protein [Falsiroseomonas tokyonensis]|uniref:Esterase-like activity of phytase family protein n=1 Tax=Falsiroseomonas tokyonensis TaxID=430521 RepID=A0ABV7BYE5_9PROT|nr:esterase-like activity of phytase family protein [Falsiroseomonas tokyonensis]MBU8539073.1 esterase-like activity of phytase family protein [Falsiroseomonas tokyonensis]
MRLRTLLLASLCATPAWSQEAPFFNRIATIEAVRMLPPGQDRSGRSIAEIVAASGDGNTLVYVDGGQRGLGFVDITDPAAPRPAGFLPLDGDPTSVATRGGRAYAVLDTSPNKTEPSGHVVVVDIAGRRPEQACELGGQPDAATISRDGATLVIVIENERDERLDGGRIPQLPPGNLTTIPLTATGLDCAALRRVDLTGIAAVAPTDPEPEFADVNGRGEAVVTLQENNHIAIVNLAEGRVVAHFSAGTVDLDQVDGRRDNVIRPTQRLAGLVREPDAVRWLDDERFVTANEGDMVTGSRGFTIFRRDGSVEWDSGNLLDHLAIRLGHYPEARSAARGNEPEGVEIATFGDRRLIFIGSERASLVSVWQDRGPGRAPAFLQALPVGVAPEGILAIPARGLLVVAGEGDNPEIGLRSTLTIHRLGTGPAAYPTLQSENGPQGTPIPWGALSGLTADRSRPGQLHAVTDSVYAEAQILAIDATATPARITRSVTVTRNGAPAQNLDIEGIAMRADGSFWLASEGNPERAQNKTANLLLRVSASGAIEEEIALPEALAATASRFGFEGVTVTGEGAEEAVWIAVQRPWSGAPEGHAMILRYLPATRAWGVLHFPLDRSPAGWMGLSEITAVGPDRFVVIERNNQWGEAAIKRLVLVSTAGLTPAEPGAAQVPVVARRLLRDMVPDLAAARGVVQEKLEGFAIDAAGEAFAVTDNDGVQGTSGETQFLRLGRLPLD